METENKINLTCNQCGSNEVIQEFDDTYVCKNCGSKFKISQQIVNVFQTQINELTTSTPNNTSPVVLINKEMTAKEFMKSAFLKFIEDDQLPIDIYSNSEFSSVHKNYAQFLVMTVHYQGSYSVSIGYDREEMYEDYEEKYNSDLGRKVRQKVIKKRTVTDWQPHSGMINQELVTSVRLGEPDKLTVYSRDSYSIYIKNDIDFLKMSGAIEDYSEENQKKIKVLTPSNEEKDVAIERGRREIVNCVSLPGDHYKDFTTSVSSKVLSSQIYIVPTWEMNFRYNDEDYYINSLAYDKRFEYYIPTAENEIKSEINSKTTGTFLLSMTASMLAIIASILILFVFKKIEYRYYTLIGIGVSLLFFIIYWVHHKSVTRDVMDDRLEQLICSLEEILSANKLPALTASEREKILMKWGKK